MASTLGEINPIRYRGYYYDTETGFYYLQSRYYDPVVGRFISPDSTDFLGVTGTTLSLNLFAYCENNAVNSEDWLGFFKISTWIVSSAIDLMITVMNPAAQTTVTLTSITILSLLKGKFTKGIAKKLLLKTVPVFKGIFKTTLTLVRTVIWRLAGVTIHFLTDYTIEKFFSKIDVVNLILTIDSIQYPSFAGWYAILLDGLSDGKIDGTITIGE